MQVSQETLALCVAFEKVGTRRWTMRRPMRFAAVDAHFGLTNIFDQSNFQFQVTEVLIFEETVLWLF